MRGILRRAMQSIARRGSIAPKRRKKNHRGTSMSLRLWSALVALTCSALLAGCAAPVQQPVHLAKDYFSAGKARQGAVGVVMAELPKPDTAFPGAGCLLCIAVANGMHQALSTQVQAFSTDELKPLPSSLVGLLRKRGVNAVLIEEPLRIDALPDLNAGDSGNKARKNFTALGTKHGVERLLVIHFTTLGVWRSYSAYVPTDVPRAVVNGDASIVDLATHSLDWYLPVAISRAAEGNWDEPPKFPGLSNAYYEALEIGMDLIKQPFDR